MPGSPENSLPGSPESKPASRPADCLGGFRCGSVNRPAADVPLLQLDDLGAEAGTGFDDIDAGRTRSAGVVPAADHLTQPARLELFRTGKSLLLLFSGILNVHSELSGSFTADEGSRMRCKQALKQRTLVCRVIEHLR